jgi:ribosomal protein S18 acetylase RimI-like enzyme
VPTIRILTLQDQPALEAFCLPRIATSMFLLSNSRAAGLADHGERYQGTYAGAFSGGGQGAARKCVGVVAHCWNKMLIPQAPEHLDELWRAAVRASGRPIGGALGPADQVGAMVEAWHAEGWPVDVQLDQQERLYVLPLEELHVPEALRAGQLRGRRITAQDVDQIVDWTVAFDVESLHEEEGPSLRQSSRASVQHKLEDGHMWVVEKRTTEGTYISVATSGFNAALREAVQIGPVYTPPELRRRGYARAVVAASLLDARAEGVRTAILFTAEDNLPAQKAYTALGFRHVEAFRLVLLRTPISGADEARRTEDEG